MGHFMNPRQYPEPDGVVQISISGMGMFSNRVVAGWEDERLSA